MISRFPDQFLPFLKTPFRVGVQLASGGFEGVLLRMPLRRKESRISDNIVTTDMVKASALGMVDAIEGSLVFGNSLTSALCGHFEPEAEDGEEAEGQQEGGLKEASGGGSPRTGISSALAVSSNICLPIGDTSGKQEYSSQTPSRQGVEEEWGLGGYFKHYSL